jgi:hypothetical protein
MLNVASHVETTFSDGKYSIRSEGTDLIYIRVQNMPFFKDLDIVQLTIFAEGVVSATMEVPMAFGTFPVIQLTGLEVDDLQIYIRHRMSVLGHVRIADLALVDLSRDGWTPLPARIMYNGAHVTEGTDHTIVPAPMMTLFRTFTG